MTQIQVFITTCVFSLLLGLGGGWYVHGKLDQAAISKEQRAQIDLANQRADDRVAEERKAKEDVEAQLAGAQAATIRLNDWLNEARTTITSLQGKISHATFSPVARPIPLQPDGKSADRCPGSAVSAPEFMQLYHAAAQGTAARGPGQASGAG